MCGFGPDWLKPPNGESQRDCVIDNKPPPCAAHLMLCKWNPREKCIKCNWSWKSTEQTHTDWNTPGQLLAVWSIWTDSDEFGNKSVWCLGALTARSCFITPTDCLKLPPNILYFKLILCQQIPKCTIIVVIYAKTLLSLLLLSLCPEFCLPIKWINSLIQNVVVETGLWKDVGTIVSELLLFDTTELRLSHFIFLRPRYQPEAESKLDYHGLPSLISPSLWAVIVSKSSQSRPMHTPMLMHLYTCHWQFVLTEYICLSLLHLKKKSRNLLSFQWLHIKPAFKIVEQKSWARTRYTVYPKMIWKKNQDRSWYIS